jgi:hypothetical protein
LKVQRQLAVRLIESIVLSAHQGVFVEELFASLRASQLAPQIGAILGRSWASLERPFNVARRFVLLTASAPNCAALHVEVARNVKHWLADGAATDPLRATVGIHSPQRAALIHVQQLLEMSAALSKTPLALSCLVAGLLEMFTPHSLRWVDEILTVSAGANGGPNFHRVGPHVEQLVDVSSEARLLCGLDDSAAHDRCKSILRILHAVRFEEAADADNGVSVPQFEADTCETSKSLFHTSPHNSSEPQGATRCPTLATACDQHPEGTAWLTLPNPNWATDDAVMKTLSDAWSAEGESLGSSDRTLILTTTTKKNIAQIALAVVDPTPIALVGKSATAKTSTVQYTAAVLKQRIERVVMNAHMTNEELIGDYAMTSNGTAAGAGHPMRFELHALGRAYTEGTWINLDEPNIAPATVFQTIGSMLRWQHYHKEPDTSPPP